MSSSRVWTLKHGGMKETYLLRIGRYSPANCCESRCRDTLVPSAPHCSCPDWCSETLCTHSGSHSSGHGRAAPGKITVITAKNVTTHIWVNVCLYNHIYNEDCLIYQRCSDLHPRVRSVLIKQSSPIHLCLFY